jgi:two-component system response regulator PilR (NtrC family)
VPLTGSVLIVDDERSVREFLRIALERAGHRVETAESPAAAKLVYDVRELDVVITDLKMPSGSGLDVLDGVKAGHAATQVIVVTAYATPETAIQAMKRGAYDYLTKPFKVDEVAVVVERALEKRALLRDNVELRAELEGRFRLERLVGKSPAMQRLFELVRKVAPARTSVLLSGESGTGKEMVARALHHLSGAPRAEGPFVAVNCGAIPEALLESELFGHVKGAFTGAVAERPGLFAAADGGTLFLDEIGELSAQMQVKLLRVLQERKVKKVGGTAEEEFDVRVVAATNRDLEAEVERGAFRRDLYYRLNVIQLHLVPLRQRREDVPLLVEHFLRKHSAALGRPVSGIEPDAMALLCEYEYPGNVRELENIVERALTLESADRVTRASLLGVEPRRRPSDQAGSPGTPMTIDREPGQALELPPDGLDLERVMGDFERELLLKALERTKGVRKEAAKLLKISFRSLRYRLAKLGVAGPDEVAEPPDGTESSGIE